jgi:peptidoglycan/xylan/chitin deacetylase (PgdA/CDA1 family)
VRQAGKTPRNIEVYSLIKNKTKMAGYRDRFIHTFNNIGNLISPQFLLNITGQRLIFPFYHVVSDCNIPHISHLYTIKRIENFIRDLDFLLKYYSPIDFNDFQELVLNKREPTKPSFLLTVDDGLKEFHDVIAPILLHKGIPAVCFLNSGFIDNKNLFFRYKESLLVDTFTQNPNLKASPRVIDWFSAYSIKPPEMLKFILSISYDQKAILDEIALLINCDFNEYLYHNSPYLTSSQVRSLINSGFCFGAHSIDHPEYQFINFEEQIRQTTHSIEEVRSLFNLDYKTFSFPFTDFNVSKQFFNKIHEDAIADITFGCAGQKKEISSTHFQRVSFEMNNLSAREIHNAELMYFIIRALFGKNTISRP